MKKVKLTKQVRLEKRVFGTEHGLSATLRNSIQETLETDVTTDSDQSNIKLPKKLPWIDEDDTEIEIPRKLKKYAAEKSDDSYQKVLRRQSERNSGNPSWADLSKVFRASGLDEDDDETRRCGNLLRKSTELAKGLLLFKKVEDLNKATRIEGPSINAVEFHPTAKIALIAGSSGIVSLVEVDGTSNRKIQTVNFKGFPIACAHFSTNGEEYIVGNKKKSSFYYHDVREMKPVQVAMHHKIGPFNMRKFRMSPDGKYIVVCGLDGMIHLLSARTKEYLCYLKMKKDVYDVSFSNDDRIMYSYGEDGDIYEWDIRKTDKYCIRIMSDEGCITGTRLASSPNGQILAAGSSTGIVNLYNVPLKDGQLSPWKVIPNLVTSITDMCFNSSSEVLAIASKAKSNALRLVHIPSKTVFSNFPGPSNFGKPLITCFSPSSGFFAVGTNHKSVLLYRLNHYKNY